MRLPQSLPHPASFFLLQLRFNPVSFAPALCHPSVLSRYTGWPNVLASFSSCRLGNHFKEFSHASQFSNAAMKKMRLQPSLPEAQDVRHY